MNRGLFRRVPLVLATVATAAAVGPVVAAAPVSAKLDPQTQFYVPPANPGLVHQIADSKAAGNTADASLLTALSKQAHAVWFTKGTPADVESAVRKTVQSAAHQHALPVLVAYNIPGRDCAGLSAGGALTTAEYKAWIDGFVKGLGRNKAIVILEPDSLGLLPSNCGTGFPFTDAARYEELNYAVDRLTKHTDGLVYLDGTHSAWLNVGDISTRLVTAGVQRANGFYLNASNFQFTPNLIQFGTWISKCIAYATLVVPGDYGRCPNQYWNGVGALSPYGIWSDTAADASLNTSFENTGYANLLGSTEATTHFVIDTSRNGRGPWQFPTGVYADPQDWCNPPGRGLGWPSTANLSVPLLDAYLWIKVPGESDGSCARGLGPAGTTVDPEWGLIDPAAGQWFPQQALQLAQLASPPLTP